MKSKTVQQQLSQCNYADLRRFDETTNTYLIPKYSHPKFELNKMYIIQLPPTITNNVSSVLAANWNNSTAPSSLYIKAYVSKILGKMIHVDSVGFDLENKRDLTNFWSGWLPTEEITQLIQL